MTGDTRRIRPIIPHEGGSDALEALNCPKLLGEETRNSTIIQNHEF